MTAYRTDGSATDEMIVEERDEVLYVTFNRPSRHNAMTWGMYEVLEDLCERARRDRTIRAIVFEGAGGGAFVAGTDIEQFATFEDGDDGLAYESKIGNIIHGLESIPKPTLAVVDGYCIGGGLVIAAACDLRIATPDSKFGAPIARTLGNCLSMGTYALLREHLGTSRTIDMIVRARTYTGREAADFGFVSELASTDALHTIRDDIVKRVLSHAPLTMWATKESMRRLRVSGLPNGDDIIRTVYGSSDFQEGVESFIAKKKPSWSGN